MSSLPSHRKLPGGGNSKNFYVHSDFFILNREQDCPNRVSVGTASFVGGVGLGRPVSMRNGRRARNLAVLVGTDGVQSVPILLQSSFSGKLLLYLNINSSWMNPFSIEPCDY